MTTVFFAGDSTAQTNLINTYPQTGIGQVLYLYLKPQVQVRNYAKNGRSTKSFMDEGRLAAIEANLQAGDFLFVEFGHNDEKYKDPTRYTTPFGTFIDNLKTFAETARKKGAYPVFITPIERRCFDENGILGPGEHGEYVAGMKQAASEAQVPCIDLYTMSRDILKKLGPVEAAKLHLVTNPGEYPAFPDGVDDHTHLSYQGAVCYAGCIAEGLKALGGVYAELLLNPDEPDDSKCAPTEETGGKLYR